MQAWRVAKARTCLRSTIGMLRYSQRAGTLAKSTHHGAQAVRRVGEKAPYIEGPDHTRSRPRKSLEGAIRAQTYKAWRAYLPRTAAPLILGTAGPLMLPSNWPNTVRVNPLLRLASSIGAGWPLHPRRSRDAPTAVRWRAPDRGLGKGAREKQHVSASALMVARDDRNLVVSKGPL